MSAQINDTSARGYAGHTAGHTAGRIAAIAAIALVIAAFGLRLIDLERQPLHFDEGNNVYFALHLSDALRVSIATHDTDPPAHRAALAGWISVAGPSPFSIRLFSVMWSALAVALCYRLLREMRLPAPASALATAILAFSPYALHYAQEAKGYSMVAALALVSWWSWLQMMGMSKHSSQPGLWPAAPVYVVSAGLMLGAHYYAAPVLAMQWLWWLGARLTIRPAAPRAGVGRSIFAGIAAQALACLPAAIWVALTLPSLVRDSTALSETFARPGLPDLVWNILSEMSAGRAGATIAPWAAIAAGALFVAGGAQLRRRGHLAVFWFGASLLVPVVGAFALQQWITFFSPRFLLYALPCAIAWMAGCSFAFTERGRAAHWPALAGTAGVAAFISGAGIVAYYASPVDTANDFRPLIRDMRPLVKTGDAALSSYIWLEGLWASYAPEAGARLRWYEDNYSPDTVERLMRPIARQHRRIWSFNFMRNPDADQTLSVHWLKQRAAYADRFVAGNLTALLFDSQTALPDARPAMCAVLDRRVRLCFQPHQTTARRGDTLSVTLRWSALQAITDDLSIFVHLIGPDGALIAQNDGNAVNGLAPGFTWQPGREVIDQRAILVRRELPTGTYRLIAGMYRRADGARLKTETEQDHVTIATVSATNP